MTNDPFTEWLESQIKRYNDAAKGQMQFRDRNDGKADAYAEALIKYRQLAPTWIPVTPETMPPFDQHVIVFCRIWGRFTATYIRISDTECGTWHDGNQSGILPPTHWMPLPAPPIK